MNMSHKDLGILMSHDGGFDTHLDTTIKKARKQIGWVCRTLVSRDVFFMKKIYIAVIRPILDYCIQLWGPLEGPKMDKLEKVQSDYTKLIPEIRNMSYKDRLSTMKMSSIQRRVDRYRILYTRKILLGKVPNPGIKIRNPESDRNGLMLEVQSKKDMILIRSQSFLVRGPETFNCLPKELRSLIG